MRQDKEIRDLFRRRIKEKLEREKELNREHIDRDVPSWITWALKPVSDLIKDAENRRNTDKGQGGEERAGFGMWLWLSKEWVVVNDLVLEPKLEEFIQLDHVLIGPQGVYLVETKTWDGTFQAYKDNWKRKQGGSWVRCDSPTKQNLRHLKLFKVWAGETLSGKLPDPPDSWLFPVVLFIKASWLRVKECSMPVFESSTSLVGHIRRQRKSTLLSHSQIEELAQALITAKPYPRDEKERVAAPPGERVQAAARPPRRTPAPSIEVTISAEAMMATTKLATGSAATVPTPSKAASGTSEGKPTVKTGVGTGGRTWVLVVGTAAQAEEVRAGYRAAGRAPTPLEEDRLIAGAWYFYLGS